MSLFKKSSFSITCDRLKKYIKEKKSFSENTGVLNLNAIISQETAQGRRPTLELFPGIEFKQENRTCITIKPGTLQLTMIYNGEVVNYDNIDAKQAAELFSSSPSITASYNKSNVAMPMASRKSLQTFLQKRKDRINSNAPYSSKQASYDEKSWLQLGLSI